MKPAAMLVRAFEIHHRIGPAVLLSTDAGEARKRLGILEHEGMRRAGVEPDVENVVDLLPVLVAELAEEALARARPVPGVGALLREGIGDARVDALVLEDVDRAVALLAHEHGDRYAPGALARDHPVGPALDHAGDAVLARRRHPARRLDGGKRAGAQRVAGLCGAALSATDLRDVLVHRDEPLRRVAEDHRLLRAPGMRVLVLEPTAGNKHAGATRIL